MNQLQIAHIDYSIATKSLDIYTIGCNGKCQGCYNSELKDWNIQGLTKEFTLQRLSELNSKFGKMIDKIIIVGGDPVDAWFNTDGLKELLAGIKKNIGKPIFLFTRHSLEDIPAELKKMVDYIKIGAYIPELATDDNIQFGIKLATSNQKIYRMEK